MKCILCRCYWIFTLLAGVYDYVTFASVYNANSDVHSHYTIENRNPIIDQHDNSNPVLHDWKDNENEAAANAATQKGLNHPAFAEPLPEKTECPENDSDSELFISKVKEPFSFPEEGDDAVDEPIMKSLKKSVCIRKSSEEIGKNFIQKLKLSQEQKSDSGKDYLKAEIKSPSIELQNEMNSLYSQHEIITNEDVVDAFVPDLLAIPDCSVSDNRKDSTLIVSTLDGQISGIDYNTGTIKWSHQTGSSTTPFFSSSISKIEVTSRGEWIQLVPSLDGGIYRFDGKSVEPLPVTADTLLHSSFQFNEDTIFTGGKFSQVIGISLVTGELIYACDINGCPSKESVSSNSEVLVVKRVSQTVRAIDPRTGGERWNFSVGQHELNFVRGDCDSLPVDDDNKPLPSIKFVLPEGVIEGLDPEDGHMLWRQQLTSPIVSAWRFSKKKLVAVDLFSSDSIPALLPSEQDDEVLSDNPQQPSLYVGIHKKQLYIQQNGKFSKKVNSAVQQYLTVINGASANEMSFPRVQWQPYLATALSRTPVVHHGTSKHPLLLDFKKKQHSKDLVVKHNFDYPYANGYYLYGDDEANFNESDSWKSPERDFFDSYPEGESFTERMYYICYEVGPQFWWKTVKLVGGVFLCLIVFMRLLYRKLRHTFEVNRDRQAFGMARNMIYHFLRGNPQAARFLDRYGVALPALSPPAPTEAPSATASTSHEGPQRQDSSFSSRYTTDFEPISCLGKGGFGVVFHVKNNLDENEYAIKRIVLPAKESSAERVKREVRALAKLNHTHIVRYYNSWLETPPPGWEKESDFCWRTGEVASSSMLSPSYPDESVAIRSSLLELSEAPRESLSGAVKRLNPRPLDNPFVLANNSEEQSSVFETDSKVHNQESSDSEDESSESKEDSKDSKDDSIEFKDDSIELKDDSIEFKDDSIEFRDECIKIKDESSEFKDESNESEDESNNSEDDVSNDSKDEAIEFKESSIISKEESIMFMSQSNVGNASHPSIEEITGTDYRKLTCITRESSKSKQRSSSFCLESQQVIHRRRVKSQGTSQGRPKSLDLLGGELRQKTPPLKTFMYIQMELCMKESLKDWLFNNTSRDTSQVFALFNDIVSAVEYVHDQSLMHRDLKPSNIFFSLDGEVKIGDFGLVTTIEEETVALTPYDAKGLDCAKDKQRTLNAGTHLYMSPEQMHSLPYNYKVDIFSLGLILFEMLVPFSTEMERRTVLLQAREQKFPTGFDRDYPQEVKLLELMLHKDPSRRLTTRGIRSRKPLVDFQRDLDAIRPEEHFSLSKTRGHSRSHSGTFSLTSSSASST